MRKTLLFLGMILGLVCANAHAENLPVNNDLNDGVYHIGVTENPTIGGTTSGAGDYNSGQSCTLAAFPNPGYSFANWTENGVPQTSNPVYTFTVTQNRDLVANFVASTYSIAASAEPYIGGSVVGAGTYGYQQTCTLMAMANPGYTFSCWTENGVNVSNSPTYSFSVTANRSLIAVFVEESFVISVTIDPTNGGTVSGAGTYTINQACTLVATPATGYDFICWKENGVPVANNPVYTFTVTAPRNLVAQFATKSYDVTATVNPEESGTISGTGTYNYGETCTLVATPNTGYSFVNWTENGQVVSTEAAYDFTVAGNHNFVANFTLKSYEISSNVNPIIGGSVTGGGTFLYGETCTMVATPSTGYTFVNWTENGQVVSTEATYEFIVTGNHSFVAHFVLQSLVITAAVNPTNSGTVSGTGTFLYGETCTLTATPATGYEFVCWKENSVVVSDEETYSFTVTASRNLVAQFTEKSYVIYATVNPAGSGTVSGTGTYSFGETCTLVATANTGYTFVNWTENGQVVSTELTCEFTVTGNRNLEANFSTNSYEVSVSANPTVGGTVEGGGTYLFGQTCTVTTVPNSGYTFINWTENGQQVSNSTTYEFTVTGDRSLVANFSTNSYIVIVDVDPEESGTITGAGGYEYGQTCDLSAIPNTGYHFVDWTENGQQVTTDSTYQFTVTSNRNFVAHFTLNEHEITVVPNGGGAIVGDGPYFYGDTCNLVATPDDCYEFVGWFENDTVVSTEPEFSFVVEGSHSFIAEFQPVQYQLNVTVNDEAMGQSYAVIDGNTYYGCDSCFVTVNCGDTCTIIAIPTQAYYHFEYWIDGNGDVFSTEATYTFVMDQDYYLTAIFNKNQYLVNPEIYPEEAGEVTGGGYYVYGDTVTICAHAYENYYFEHWIINDTLFVDDTCYTFVVYGEDHIIAVFYYDDAVSESLSSTIAIYPNPAHDAVRIEGEDINRVRVYNVYGQLMGMIETRKQSSIRLEFGDYPSGTYILMMDTDQGSAVKRFVKQ